MRKAWERWKKKAHKKSVFPTLLLRAKKILHESKRTRRRKLSNLDCFLLCHPRLTTVGCVKAFVGERGNFFCSLSSPLTFIKRMEKLIVGAITPFHLKSRSPPSLCNRLMAGKFICTRLPPNCCGQKFSYFVLLACPRAHLSLTYQFQFKTRRIMKAKWIRNNYLITRRLEVNWYASTA